jgi:CheY-like chemotaxis protein
MDRHGLTQPSVRLLVVDDHPINRELLILQLEQLGLAADSCGDGSEALAVWTPGRHAVVLVDLRMPGMDGYELTRRLRVAEAERGVSRTPIVAVTANAPEGQAEHCLAADMDGFLSKPTSLDALARTMSRWVPDLRCPTETPSRAEPSATLFDPARLRGLFGDDPVFLRRQIEKFADASTNDVGALAAARTAAAIEDVAHRLKGAARTVGAVRLAELAGRVEAAGHSGDLPGAQRAAAGIESLLADTLRAGRDVFGPSA